MEKGDGHGVSCRGLGMSVPLRNPVRQAFLQVEYGAEREIPLTSGSVWKIGRTDENAIVLEDDMISRNHAMIQRFEDGGYYLTDLGSRNGSFVNRRRVTAPVALHDGDRLEFGKAQVLFRNPAQRATEPVFAPLPVGAGAQTIALFNVSTVSVLVADIRGFTGLAQKAKPDVLSQLVTTWLGEADRITHYHGSSAQKHIGDAVMAVWTHRAEGSERLEILQILRATAEIARITATLHERVGLDQPVRIGAGVNTGLAAMGNTGASDFTVIGESVNAAFRLESATKELAADVVLGASTFEHLRIWPHALQRFHSSEVRLKGYDAPVKTHHISFAELDMFLEQQVPLSA
jgi:adenylate cyclase